jgi:uncharacterized repeat protein (TIGR03803 family)
LCESTIDKNLLTKHVKTTARISTRPPALERRIGSSFYLTLLAGALIVMLASRLAAQTFSTLHSFTALRSAPGFSLAHPDTNGDGAIPKAPLVLSSNILYGTTHAGGAGAGGTVFAVNTDGSGFTNLLNFTLGASDGYYPYAGLVMSSDTSTLYGTTGHSFTGTSGVEFSINTDGTGFTPLYGLADSPHASLILSNGTLYGTVPRGEDGSDDGKVFAVNTDGTGFTILHSFPLVGCGRYPCFNSDGAYPQTQLVLSGNTLYGIADGGGAFGFGTVFAVNIDGTGFTVLHTLTGGSDGAGYLEDYALYSTGFPGTGNPRLVLSGNTLYGAAGTVFSLNTDGTRFTVLHGFGGTDGWSPSALVISGNVLYGTVGDGGSFYNGSVFKLNTDGTGFTVLHNFKATSGAGPHDFGGVANSDGAYPNSLILSGDTLYGTTATGGGSGCGTVFSLSLLPVTPPQLAITRAGGNVILTWPTNSSGYFLQSSTNLSAAPWTALPPRPGVPDFPVVVNGQNTVTNPISGAQQFFRLTQ